MTRVHCRRDSEPREPIPRGCKPRLTPATDESLPVSPVAAHPFKAPVVATHVSFVCWLTTFAAGGGGRCDHDRFSFVSHRPCAVTDASSAPSRVLHRAVTRRSTRRARVIVGLLFEPANDSHIHTGRFRWQSYAVCNALPPVPTEYISGLHRVTSAATLDVKRNCTGGVYTTGRSCRAPTKRRPVLRMLALYRKNSSRKHRLRYTFRGEIVLAIKYSPNLLSGRL